MSDVHPGSLDYDLDDVVVADTPARLKALAHPLRSLVVDLVLERAMTVTEIADLAGRPRGSVAHHVDVLVDAGLLRVVRTRRVRAIEERFYGRTARTIQFTGHGPGAPGDLPFFADARAEYDHAAADADDVGGFTYRHARIPAEHAAEFTERLMELALEFTRLPRGGDREYAVLVGVFPTTRLAPRRGTTTRGPTARRSATRDGATAPAPTAPAPTAPAPTAPAPTAPATERRPRRTRS